MVRIEEINPINKKVFKKWVDFPNKLYKNVPYYVPCLFGDEMNLAHPKKNVAFDECEAKYFIAYNGEQVVGRVAAILHRTSNEKEQVKNVRFSRFDFVNDLEVVKGLLGAVENFAREKGMDTVHGPYGFNDMDREGMLIQGFDKVATFATNYNFDYYAPLIESCGYEVENTWSEYRIKVPKVLPEKVLRVAEIAEVKYGLRIPVEKNLKVFIKKYITKLFDAYDITYGVLPNTMPISPKMRVQMQEQFMIAINKRYVAVVLNAEDDVVGIALAFPLISKAVQKSGGKLTLPTILKVLKEVSNPTGLEFAIIGAIPGYDRKGAAALILRYIHENMMADGIMEAETNPELVTNMKIQSLWNEFEKEQHKSRVTVKKFLG